MIFVWIIIILLSITIHKRTINREKDILYLSNYLSTDEINYIINNKINIEEVKPYLEYNNFNIYNFYSYQKIKNDYNLSYLESINYYNNPNFYRFYVSPKPALFSNSHIILVNKCFYLEPDYVPNNLENVKDYEIDFIFRINEEILLKKVVLQNYKVMYDDAKMKNIDLVVFSGYRSYSKQSHLYYNVYHEDDSISARPGFSEHQTGYAIDISTHVFGLTDNFKNADSYKWLTQNAHKYGFILRFPEGKENITGYSFEPWHFRYVGSIASILYEKNLTFEEYVFSNLEI